MTLKHLWEMLQDIEEGRISAKEALETITINVPSFNGGYAVLDDGWRDVRKELPDCGVRVMIFRDGAIIIGVCSSHHPLWYNDAGFQIERVIAWRELPDPPDFV